MEGTDGESGLMGLDTVELVLLVEKRFNLELGEAELSGITRVGEFCDLLHARLQGPGHPGPDRDAIYATLSELLVQHFRVPPAHITPQARFVADLGLE